VALLRGDERARAARRRICVALAAVLMLAAAFAYSAVHAGRVPLCVAFLSTAMGLQSVVAVRSGVRGVSSVYVTGTLITAITDAFDKSDASTRIEGGLNWTAWALYLGGATAGALALDRLGLAALWPAAVAVALLFPFAA
jgi:uncharacterized membrane protein YoaK (UPF0700 family)